MIPTILDVEWIWNPHDSAKAIWIDVVKFEYLWQEDYPDFYIGPGGENGAYDRYERFGQFLHDQCGKGILMSEIALPKRRNRHDKEVDAASFVDGGHRFSWMRDHGARALPVVVSLSFADEAKRLLSTDSRVCRVRYWRPETSA
jgi:hypothetical protein